jgi:hypothetical protein
MARDCKYKAYQECFLCATYSMRGMSPPADQLGKMSRKIGIPPVAQSGLPDMPASIFAPFHLLSK